MDEIVKIRRSLLSLAKFRNLRSIILFGSRARGDNKTCSDYDLAAIVETGDVSEWLEIEDDIRNHFKLPVDIIDYKNASSSIKEQINAQGILVFLNEKFYISLVRSEQAIASLEDIICDEDDEKHKQRDAVLTRFEYIFELMWKSLGHLLFMQGFDEKTPREIIVRAGQVGWLDSGLWLDILKKRNNIAHSYNEELAEEVFEFAVKKFPVIKETYNILWNKFAENAGK